MTPAGFHAIVLSSAGTVYVDPHSRGDLGHYISYFERDFRKAKAQAFKCEVHGDIDSLGAVRSAVGGPRSRA